MAEQNEQTHKSDNSPIPASCGVPTGEQLRNELANDSVLIDKLKSSFSSLPYVNDNQESECPYAETSYAQKEELEERLISRVKELKRYATALDREVHRCTENHQLIQTGSGKIHRQDTLEHFSLAQETQREQCDRAIEDRDAVFVVLAKAQAVLNVSRTRKYPGKKPEEQFPSPFSSGIPESLPAPTQPPEHQPPAGGLGDEVTGLMSLGPLGGTLDSRAID